MRQVESTQGCRGWSCRCISCSSMWREELKVFEINGGFISSSKVRYITIPSSPHSSHVYIVCKKVNAGLKRNPPLHPIKMSHQTDIIILWNAGPRIDYCQQRTPSLKETERPATHREQFVSPVVDPPFLFFIRLCPPCLFRLLIVK